MPKTVYVVTEKYPTGGISGINVNVFKSEEAAVKHFKKLIVDNTDPNVTCTKKALDKAVAEGHWSCGEGDYDQEIVLQIGEEVVK